MTRGVMDHGASGLVSVIIPTRNRAALVAEAIGSVLAQDFTPVEVLVVDDDTEVVIRELQQGASG